MVFLDLSVVDTDATRKFYVDELGLFSEVYRERISCICGVELIVDLHQTGTERHLSIFGQEGHSVSSFAVSHGKRGEEIRILSSLKAANISYDEVANLGGHRIHLKDPSGNAFTILGELGVFK